MQFQSPWRADFSQKTAGSKLGSIDGIVRIACSACSLNVCAREILPIGSSVTLEKSGLKRDGPVFF